jgi:hypothetical protein
LIVDFAEFVYIPVTPPNVIYIRYLNVHFHMVKATLQISVQVGRTTPPRAAFFTAISPSEEYEWGRVLKRLNFSLAWSAISLGESPRSASSRSGSLFYTAPWWGGCLERVEQTAGDGRDGVYGSNECGSVDFGRLVEAGYLAYELPGGLTNLFLGHRRVEVIEWLDISAHRFCLAFLPY